MNAGGNPTHINNGSYLLKKKRSIANVTYFLYSYYYIYYVHGLTLYKSRAFCTLDESEYWRRLARRALPVTERGCDNVASNFIPDNCSHRPCSDGLDGLRKPDHYLSLRRQRQTDSRHP